MSNGFEVDYAQIYKTFHTGIPILGDFQLTETLIVSWIVMIIITGLCIFLTRNLKVENISKRQAVAEWIVELANNFVVNNTDGSIVGYKYFNFTALQGKKNVRMLLRIIPEGIDGTIVVMADSPWASQRGLTLGKVDVKADMPTQTPIELTIPLPGLSGLTGKHALFSVFKSTTKEKSLCWLADFVFD